MVLGVLTLEERIPRGLLCRLLSSILLWPLKGKRMESSVMGVTGNPGQREVGVTERSGQW